MTDKIKPEDLRGAFKNIGVQIGDVPEEGAGVASIQYAKYGIYCDTGGTTEFICVIMERDEESVTPDDQLTEDDYVQGSVLRYNFVDKGWESAPGLMKLVSSGSFSFISEDDFVDQLHSHRDTFYPESKPEGLET